MATIIAAAITSLLGLLGVVLTNNSSNRKIEQKLETAQAITDVKLEALTKEVQKHNNFASRMPVVEEQIKVINHRIDDLEKRG